MKKNLLSISTGCFGDFRALAYASTGQLYESNQSRTVYVSPQHSSPEVVYRFFLPGGLFVDAGVVAPCFYEHSIIATDIEKDIKA